jgi:AcrR family transcriptional regulator
VATEETKRQLATDKALRIVDAMRSSVARRGVAGSTFDHVAREAGVSRGLLHYYFGSKERLLVEVAKRDSEVRFAAMAAQLERAENADQLVGQWVRSLQATVKHEPEFVTMLLELYTLAQRNPEIADELAGVMQGMTDAIAHRSRQLQEEGVIELVADPETVADVMLGFGYGMALRLLADPSRDMDGAIEVAATAARGLYRDL